MKKMQIEKRYISLDVLKSICIILMILEHIVIIALKLNAQFWNVDVNHGLYNFIELCDNIFTSHYLHNFKYIIVGIFFILSGISFHLSKNNSKRFFKLLVCSILINITTLLLYTIFNIDCLVMFGILNSMSCCLLIWILIDKIKNKNIHILFAFVFLIISILFAVFSPKLNGTNALMWLGVPKTDYRSGFDYFPLFPWLALYSIGFLINLKPKKDKAYSNIYKKFACIPVLVSKYSIYLYLLHIPIIVGILIIVYSTI